jgi:hypothetical protein
VILCDGCVCLCVIRACCRVAGRRKHYLLYNLSRQCSWPLHPAVADSDCFLVYVIMPVVGSRGSIESEADTGCLRSALLRVPC